MAVSAHNLAPDIDAPVAQLDRVPGYEPGGREFESLRAHQVEEKADALPHDKRAKATITCWSALKAKFGVTYKEIAQEHFTDAVSLLSRITLEGEYIPAGVSTEKDELSYATGRAILSDIRQLANAYLSGTEQRIMMTECDKLERVLVSGFTEMNESLMRIQSAAFMLSRWSKH